MARRGLYCVLTVIAIPLIAILAAPPFVACIFPLPAEFPLRLNVPLDSLRLDNNTSSTVWSSQWYALDTEDKRVHVTNDARVAYFDKHLSRHPTAGRLKRVLDVGCGDGIVAESLAALGYKVTAVDVGLPFLEHAQNQKNVKKIDNIQYFQADATSLPFQDNAFDGVVMADILEHMPHLEQALKEAGRVLRSKGSLVISTIHRGPISFVFQSLLHKLMPGYPTEGHDWRLYVTLDELEQAMSLAGFDLGRSDNTALFPTFWPSIRHFQAESDHRGLIGKFIPVRGYLPGVRRILPAIGPFLVSAQRQPKSEEDETVWFPAIVKHADGTLEMPTQEEMDAFSVDFNESA